MIKFLRNIGPGPLVAAAFIGPGTVTLCTIAGVNFGFALLWALLLSIFATIILQEMAARLGIVTQKGLSEVIRQEIKNKNLRNAIILLILSAIVVGNAAYEAGNISGGVLGIEALFGATDASGFKLWPVIIGVFAFALLWIGNYKVLERALILLVVLMSLAFITTAVLTKPNVSSILEGMFIPNFSSESIIMVVGLIGTTVVPYNIFLHASLAKSKWNSTSDLSNARKDTVIAVVLGGIVSMCILISAAGVGNQNVNNTVDLAVSLKPLFGDYSSYFLSIGLFAAGITSAITAPLATAYVVTGCFGWESSLKGNEFRIVWIAILILGVLFSSIDFTSIEIIKFAQIANGLLLPIIAGILIFMVSKTSVLGKYKNSNFQNILGAIVLIITVFLGARMILRVFDVV